MFEKLGNFDVVF